MANNEPVSHFELEYAGFFVQEAMSSAGLSAGTSFTPAFAGGNSKETIPVRGSVARGSTTFRGFGTGAHDPFHIGYALFGYAFLTAYDEWKCNFVCFFSAFDLADDCCRVTGEVEFCGQGNSKTGRY